MLLGALLATGIGTLSFVEGATSTAPPDGQKFTLGGILAIEQSFTSTQPNLVGLRLRLRPDDSSPADLLLPIHLRYADGPPVDIVRASAPVGAIKDGLLTFRFPTPVLPRDPHLITGTLRLIIDVPSLPPSTGPTIITQQTAAGQSEMLIDAMPVPGQSLAIIPLYERRWIDSLWPISAMAAGKPGLLGWPPLYTLLPYLYLVAVAEATAALRRASRM